MARAWRWVALASAAGVLMACSMMKKKAAPDAGEEAGPSVASAEPEAAAPPQATNETQVTRYPDEKSVDHAPLTTETTANLRTQVGSGGDLVVVLKKGTEVEKIAERGGSYLVLADDPKEPARKLMGWVVESAFTAETPHRREEHDGGVADAGKPSTVDAGGHPSAFVCVKQSAPGKCPAGFVVSNAVCRVPCKTPADCKGPEPKCNTGLCYASNGCE